MRDGVTGRRGHQRGLRLLGSMMQRWACVLAFVLVLRPAAAPAEESLYQKRSQDQGITAFDLTVTETNRAPRTSLLRVPGFHDRSAAGSRWLMCAYTDLAIQRGFGYWAAVYPTPPSEEVLVGFPKTEKEDLSGVDQRFTNGVDGPIVGSVEKFSAFCGITKPPQP